VSTALEAGSAEAAEEATAALEAEESARRDAENAETARLAAEAAETGMTQAEREAAAEHDGGSKPKRSRKRAPAQGNLDGGWEEIIGGNSPSESKINLSGPSFQPVNPPAHIRKGAKFRILVEVTATGYAVDDTLDSETHEVSSTKEKRKLRVTGGRFLEPDEYVVNGAGESVE
jgi:hypothetical protein